MGADRLGDVAGASRGDTVQGWRRSSMAPQSTDAEAPHTIVSSNVRNLTCLLLNLIVVLHQQQRFMAMRQGRRGRPGGGLAGERFCGGAGERQIGSRGPRGAAEDSSGESGMDNGVRYGARYLGEVDV